MTCRRALGCEWGGAKRGEWELQSAPRKASGSGEAALAGSHSDLPLGGAPLPCARHFLWGTFLSKTSAHTLHTYTQTPATECHDSRPCRVRGSACYVERVRQQMPRTPLEERPGDTSRCPPRCCRGRPTRCEGRSTPSMRGRGGMPLLTLAAVGTRPSSRRYHEGPWRSDRPVAGGWPSEGAPG